MRNITRRSKTKLKLQPFHLESHLKCTVIFNYILEGSLFIFYFFFSIGDTVFVVEPETQFANGQASDEQTGLKDVPNNMSGEAMIKGSAGEHRLLNITIILLVCSGYSIFIIY